MLKQQQRRYEMFLKVRDFGVQYADAFPVASAAGKALATIAESAAVIEHQSSQRLVSAQAGKKDRAAARKALWDRLTAIARAARGAGATDPPARDVFRLPKRQSDAALLDTARAFIDAGETASARWVAFGLPETSIAELRDMIDAFEQAIDTRRQGQAGVRAARKALADAFRTGNSAARQLDVIVANTQAPDSAIAIAWKEARRTTPIARAESKAAAPDDVAPAAGEPVVSSVPIAVVPVVGPGSPVPSVPASAPADGAAGDVGLRRAS